MLPIDRNQFFAEFSGLGLERREFPLLYFPGFLGSLCDFFAFCLRINLNEFGLLPRLLNNGVTHALRVQNGRLDGLLLLFKYLEAVEKLLHFFVQFRVFGIQLLVVHSQRV
ncbi:hypothetical protein SDC9_96273 [bioreactor metagenome]|uniref:Uncharacterized protein n=1 Tax=bioreactor metagenome TaxID=1076179 RepID=A0A645AFC9_9ZZZZ